MTKTRDEAVEDIKAFLRGFLARYDFYRSDDEPLVVEYANYIAAGVIPQWRHITVTIERDYGECGHMDNGCSGWESVEVIATDGERTERHKQASCFGTSEIECFEYVMNKWNRLPAPPYNPAGE